MCVGVGATGLKNLVCTNLPCKLHRQVALIEAL